MPAPYTFITQADLEDRLSVETVKAILDDNNDGTVDVNPVLRLRKDASSYVAGFLRGIYDLDGVAASPPGEVVRLTLDVAQAYGAKRHPEYVRADWERLLKAARADLVDLRNGITRLDVAGLPEPAGNQGGEVLITNSVLLEEKTLIVVDGEGDL